MTRIITGSHIIIIDIGTSAAKVAILSRDFERIAAASRDQDTIRTRPGWAEQDPKAWWNMITSATLEVLGKSGIDPREIAVVGVTAQMHGPVPVDKEGNPLMNCIIWAEVRAQAEAVELNRKISRVPSLRGMIISPHYTAAKIMWIKRHRLDVYQRIHKILLPKDYIRFRLTKNLATDVTDAVGSQMFDPEKQRWNKPLLDAMEISESILPKVKNAVDIAGEVTEEAAKETGIPAGTPVIVGGGDGSFIQIGLGEINVGDAYIYMGTAPATYICIDHEIKDTEHIYCTPLPNQPGKWLIGGFNGPTIASLSWCEKELGNLEAEAAKKEGVNIFQMMDKEAERVPPGSDGLIILPHFQGERAPLFTTDAKATIFGLRLGHTHAHIIRAILESVGYAARSVTEVAEKKYGITFSRIRLYGGGSKSIIWRQIIADIFGRPVLILKDPEISSLGLAYAAAVGIGWYKNFGEIGVQPNPIVETVQPNMESSKTYQSIFKIYQKLDQNMLEMYTP